MDEKVEKKVVTHNHGLFDRYVVGPDGKFIHVTPQFYNPHFDPPRGSKGKKLFGDSKWVW